MLNFHTEVTSNVLTPQCGSSQHIKLLVCWSYRWDFSSEASFKPLSFGHIWEATEKNIYSIFR